MATDWTDLKEQLAPEPEGSCLDPSPYNPVPIPDLTGMDLPGWETEHLSETMPIDDPAFLALHVARLTATVKDLWEFKQWATPLLQSLATPESLDPKP